MFNIFGKKKNIAKKVMIEGKVSDELETLDSDKTLLAIALDNGVDFPHKCKVGGCGSCKCQLVEGKVKELKDSSYILSGEDLKNNYILACQSIPKTDIKVIVPKRK